MPVTVGSRIAHYEVRALIGEGGMGQVFRAFDSRLHREVAVKVLPDSIAGDHDRLARFEREARTLAALNHPHIAQVYDVAESAIVMELVEGDSLADLVARGPMPLEQVLPIAQQIVDALQVAHDAGIVHRDLKPANIKVRGDGTVKLLDFGLARSASPADSSGSGAGAPTITTPAMTAHGVILGTAAYMSPEQARGKPTDQRTDIWAFGCVLYEMLTGRRLFDGETVSDTIAAILSRDASLEPLPRLVPAHVRALLARCLARDPRVRLHHIADARFDLVDTPIGVAVASTPSRHAWARSAVIGMLGAVAGVAGALIARPLFTSTAADPPQLMQLAVPMPVPNAAANGVLLSPDGRHLISIGPSGATILHHLDGSPSQPLEDLALCWSPDSRSLILQRLNGELHRMDLSGAASVAFSTAPLGFECSWNERGTLLIHDSQGTFYQLSVNGGTPAPLKVDSPSRVLIRTSPQFLPDGRRFLFFSLTEDGVRAIRAGSLDSPQTTLVVESPSHGLYVNGHLLFHRGATLVAQPLDEKTLTLTGQPRAITTEAAPGNAVSRMNFSVSRTGLLAFGTTNGGIKGELVWVNRRGEVTGRIAQPNTTEMLNPVLSRDGRRLAATRMDPATGNWDVWMTDLTSGELTRLTSNPASDSDAVWSPDGNEIAYISRRLDAPGIYRLSIAERREQLVLKSAQALALGAGGLRTTDWSPDGRLIVFDDAGEIRAIRVDDPKDVITLVRTPDSDFGGMISPDGRWLAFQSGPATEPDVYVQPFSGNAPSTRVSRGISRHVLWRNDGAELFWMAATGPGTPFRGLTSATVSFSGNTVRASAPVSVLPPHVSVAGLVDSRRHYAASADGQQFLIRQQAGNAGPAVKVLLNWPQLLTAPR